MKQEGIRKKKKESDGIRKELDIYMSNPVSNKFIAICPPVQYNAILCYSFFTICTILNKARFQVEA